MPEGRISRKMFVVLICVRTGI